MAGRWITVDGNEAAASVAHGRTRSRDLSSRLLQHGRVGRRVVAKGHKNIWGIVPEVIEMQSEGGASGACTARCRPARCRRLHGEPGSAPDDSELYKIAGELNV